MDAYLKSLFDGFRTAALESSAKNDKYIIIDKVYESLQDLSVFPFQDVLQRILALIEEFPELDYGGPGPFGSFIEEHPLAEYTPALLESIKRQPSTQVIHWLDRSVMDEDFQNHDKNPISPEQFVKCLADIIKGEQASGDCKEFAQICLTDLRKRGHFDA